MASSKVISVFLVSSGLGHINRGYESFTRECFEALKDLPEVDITLFKGGGGAAAGDVTLWNLRRESLAARWLGKIIDRGAYAVEQITFTFSLIPYIMRRCPDIIYFSDGTVGNTLWHFRRFTKLKYKLLFSNGGPLAPPFPRWDLVQQVAPSHAQTALRAGQREESQCIVPYGFQFDPLPPPDISETRELRNRLKIPQDRSVILSIGALNSRHKRMDYLISEVARLPVPRPYLVLLGQQDDETPGIRKIATDCLGEDGYTMGTVPAPQVRHYLRAADVFVLASLSEGFGRVVGESCAQGLRCAVHDYPLMRDILGDTGYFSNFKKEGMLAATLERILKVPASMDEKLRIQNAASDRFNWKVLSSQYMEMFRACLTTCS